MNRIPIMASYRQREKHLRCPFNECHSILPERFLQHIIKCKIANRDKASAMVVCIYSNFHWVKIEDYGDHLKHCPSAKNCYKMK